jgi:hypothetical protein
MSIRPHAVVECDDIKLIIVEANGKMGMRRSVLRYNSKPEEYESEETKVLRVITYPDLVSSVLSGSGTIGVYDENDSDTEIVVDFSKMPIPFPLFCMLPDRLLAAWEEACYQMNPHWNPETTISEAAKKKELKSIEG